MTWKKRNSSYSSFIEQEEMIFKDFVGDKTISENYHMKGLDEAITLSLKFRDKPTRIVGDYDVDGVTSTAELKLFLHSLGFKDVDSYLPKRFSDGYGLSASIVEKFLFSVEKDGGLLFTVDNGISANEAVEKAKSLGWTIIILDHHLSKETLPCADIIIDANAVENSADFNAYCAAGVVLKLAQEAKDLGIFTDDAVMAKIQSFAALGTACDSVPLIEQRGESFGYDNYIILKNGLKTIISKEGCTTGLYCLLRALNKETLVSEEDMSFIIGPTMNAVSRLNDDGASDVLEFILMDGVNFNKYDEIVQKFINFNETRKYLTSTAVPALEKQIADNNWTEDYALIVSGDKEILQPGIVGLIAAKLTEKYVAVSIVFSEREDGILHGSARSVPGINIVEVLDQCKDLLIKYGGHAAAAGASLKAENLDELRTRINKILGKKPESLKFSIYDYEISPEDIKENIETLTKYAPFGKGHEKPLFKIKDFQCLIRYDSHYKVLGADKKTIKLNGRYGDALNFNGKGVKKFFELKEPTVVDLYGTLSINEWNGHISNQVIFSDIEDTEDTI